MPQSPFPFLSGSLALDFVNTEIPARRGLVDLLKAPGDFTRWWAEAQDAHPDFLHSSPHQISFDDNAIRDLKALRADLRRGFDALAQDPKQLADVLNRALASIHPRIEVSTSGELTLQYVPSSSFNAISHQIVLSAMDLIGRGGLPRVHACSSFDCNLFFCDLTKSGTRKWCSTRCFDRARAKERRTGAGVRR